MGKDDPQAQAVREVGKWINRIDQSDRTDRTDLSDQTDRTDSEAYAAWLTNADPAVVANAVHLSDPPGKLLLDRLIAGLESQFIQAGRLQRTFGGREALRNGGSRIRPIRPIRPIGRINPKDNPELPELREADGPAHCAQGRPCGFSVLGLHRLPGMQGNSASGWIGRIGPIGRMRAMSTIGQIEKKTQRRVVKLFRETLGYDYLGDWDRSRGQPQHRAGPCCGPCLKDERPLR